MQANRDKEPSMDEVQTQYNRIQKEKIPWGVWMFVLYVVSKDKKAKCKNNQDK